ncbi:MAG: polysaccharide deacetylase family protein [Candidatus Omnitrophica bacterium]|nr:polysaccharide deacetylase family protein [Candidatus Omnitrophota bacterium]
MNDHFPVLNYHGIESKNGEYPVSAAERDYFISKGRFREQLEFLKEEKFTSAGISDLDDLSGGRLVVVTFDDGHISSYEHAAPLLKEFEMRAVFFIPVSFVGRPGYMDWTQIKELESNGFDIGSHGLDHIPLTALDEGRLKSELVDSKKALSDRLGKEIDAFSVPRGFYNARVRAVARENGYRYVFTSKFGLNSSKTDSLAMLRIAVKSDTGYEDFGKWIRGDFGVRGLVEGMKDAARSIIPPAWYDQAAGLKRAAV